MDRAYDVKLYFKSIDDLFEAQHCNGLEFTPDKCDIERGRVVVSRIICSEQKICFISIKYSSDLTP